MLARSTRGIVALALMLACSHSPSGGAASTSIPPAPAPPVVTATTPASSAPTLPPLPTVAADPGRVYDGWRLFHIHCFRCHGFDAEGGGAPNLRETVQQRLTRQGFIVTVLGGRPDRGMPTWGDFLTPADAELIYDYVVERATGRLPPGRPTRPE
jgi:mono/diheme cytochrome c family protein